MLKAILFDAYGTLISTGNGSVQAAQAVGIPACWLNRKGIEKPADLFPAYVASDLQQVCDLINHFSS